MIKRFSSFAFLSNFSLSVYLAAIDDDSDEPNADTTADDADEEEEEEKTKRWRLGLFVFLSCCLVILSACLLVTS